MISIIEQNIDEITSKMESRKKRQIDRRQSNRYSNNTIEARSAGAPKNSSYYITTRRKMETITFKSNGVFKASSRPPFEKRQVFSQSGERDTFYQNNINVLSQTNTHS